MMTHIGNLFSHDDTVTDRSEGSKLNNADLKTREHWKRIYNEGFATFGAMYRGPPPEGVLYRISADETYGYCTKHSAIHVGDISIQLQRSLRKVRLNVLGRNVHYQENGLQLMHVKKSGLRLTGHSNFTWTREDLGAEGSFVFDTKEHTGLHFVLLKIVGFGVFKSNKVISCGSFDLCQL